ncbi:MAG TPA: class I SAM-dependent methyltransferase [Actinomycetota bacterium]
MTGRPVARQFGRVADIYAEAETRRYPPDLVLGLADPDHDDLHLDVGTGPGTLAGLIGPHVTRSVGTDVTPEMLDLCMSRTHGVDCIRADAHRLPFEEEAFTLVTCGSVFHHLEDPVQAVTEAARVLRPGGRFLLIDMAGPEHPARRQARDEVERARDYTHVGILAPSQVQAMLDGAGFDLREEERQVEDRRDDDWARVAGADLEAVRKELRRHQRLAGGFQALRWEGDHFLFRRERAYYLAVRR